MTGLIEFGFSEPIMADRNSLITESALPARRRRLEKLLVDHDSQVYRRIEAFEINLESSKSDEAEPISVEWELIDFDGQIGHIQMDMEKLQKEDIDYDIYDDISIAFNDGAGVMKSTDGKQVNFGTTITW